MNRLISLLVLCMTSVPASAMGEETPCPEYKYEGIYSSMYLPPGCPAPRVPGMWMSVYADQILKTSIDEAKKKLTECADASDKLADSIDENTSSEWAVAFTVGALSGAILLLTYQQIDKAKR